MIKLSKKHYVLFGIAVFTLVFAVIVIDALMYSQPATPTFLALGAALLGWFSKAKDDK